MTIGEQIKKTRKKVSLSQVELGKRLGVTGAAIAQYETGRRIPKRETLDKISRALGVQPYELLPTQDEPPIAEQPTCETTVEKRGDFMKPEEYIRNEVERRGMTIRFLSDKANVPYGRIQPSLNGHRSLRADEYLRICDFLQIEPRIAEQEKGA